MPMTETTQRRSRTLVEVSCCPACFLPMAPLSAFVFPLDFSPQVSGAVVFRSVFLCFRKVAITVGKHSLEVQKLGRHDRCIKAREKQAEHVTQKRRVARQKRPRRDGKDDDKMNMIVLINEENRRLSGECIWKRRSGDNESNTGIEDWSGTQHQSGNQDTLENMLQ